MAKDKADFVFYLPKVARTSQSFVTYCRTQIHIYIYIHESNIFFDDKSNQFYGIVLKNAIKDVYTYLLTKWENY